MISTASQNLLDGPKAGDFGVGRLSIAGSNSFQLASNSYFGIAWAEGSPAGVGQTADIQWIFLTNRTVISGLFGSLETPYPTLPPFSFTRIDAIAAWGAWEGAVLLGVGVVAWAALVISWWVLATVYSLPYWACTRIAGAAISLLESWRVCAGALLTGALWMTMALISYSLGWIRVPVFLVLGGLHFVIPWVVLLAAVPHLNPRELTSDDALDEDPKKSVAGQTRRKNPFRQK